MALTAEKLAAYLNPNAGDPVKSSGIDTWMKQSIMGSAALGIAPGPGYKGGTEYDQYMNEMADQDELRGQMQTGWDKIKRGALSRTASVLPKVIQGFGHIGGFLIDVGRAATGQTEYDNLGDIFRYSMNNALVEAMSQLDDNMRENVLGINTKIWDTLKYKEGDIIDQLGTPEFYANDLFDGVAFAGSALLPGLGISKLGKVAFYGNRSLKLAKAMGSEIKGIKLGNAFNKLDDLKGKMTAEQLAQYNKMAEGINKLTIRGTTGYNTISEAGFEAFDTGEQLKQQVANDRYGMSFEDLPEPIQMSIKKEVAPHQAETALMNAAILLAPNYIQSKFFFGKTKDSTSLIKKGLINGTIKPEDISKSLGKQFVGSLGKNIGKNVLTGILSEGVWEEGVQTAIQDYESRKSAGLTDDNWFTGVAQSYVDGLFTTEGQKSMILGAMIGGGMGVRGGWSQYKQKKAQADLVGESFKNNMTNMLSIRNTYQDDVRRFIKSIDKDGVPEYDTEAIFKATVNGMNNATNFNEAFVASLKEDDMHLGMVNREALSRLAYSHFTNEFYDNLDQAEQAIVNDLDFTAAASDNPQYMKTIAEEHKKVVGNLKEAFKNMEKSLPEMEDLIVNEEGKPITDETRKEFMDIVRTNMFYEQMKADYLTEMKGKAKDEYKAGFDAAIKDANDRIEELKDKTKRSKLLQEYRDFKDTLKSHRDTLTKTDATVEQKRQAQYEINKSRFLNGESQETARFFPGSQKLEQRTKNKIPVRNQVHATIAMQQLNKSRIREAGEDFRNDRITSGQLVNTIRQNFDYITESVKKEIDNTLPVFEEKISGLMNQITPINEKIQELEDEGLYSEVAKLEAAKKPLQDKLSELVRDRDALAELYNSNSENREYVQNVSDHFVKGTIGKFEEAVYAANFTDNNGTVIPEQANKLLAQLEKESEEDMTADLGLLGKVIDAFEEQKRVFGQEGYKQQLEDEEFKKEVLTQLKRSIPGIEHSGTYLESLDNTIEELKRLQGIIKNNKDNRQTKQKEAYRVESIIKFNGLGFTDNGTVEDNSIHELLEGVIGVAKLKEIVDEAIKNDMDGAYADLIVELYKKNASPEQIELLVGRMNAIRSESVAELEKICGNTNVTTVRYTQNPEGRFRTMLNGDTGTSGIFEGSDFNNPKTPPYKYDRTRSLGDFENAVRAYPGMTEEKRKNALRFIEMHKRIVGRERIINSFRSTASLATATSIDRSDINEMKKEKVFPSAQQHSAIRALITFFKRTNINTNDLSAFAFMSGEAGTGKTTVVLKRLLRHLGLKPEQILATASNANAIDTMDKATGVTGKTIEEVINTDLEGKKVILLDEAGALSKDQLNALMDKVNTHNSTREVADMVRVVMVGDPNQIGAKIKNNYPIVADYTEVYGTITQIPPLTVPYRSDVSSLTEFANEFKDNISEVTNAFATASAPLEELSDKTVGVHTGPREKIKDAIMKVAGIKGNTVAVIVDDEASKANYAGLPDNVEILTFREAQGRSIDRVFIDINKNRISTVEGEDIGDFAFNKVMYTSITRARVYAFVANNHNNLSQAVDKGMTEDKTSRAEDIEKNGEWFIEQIRKEEDLKKKFIDGKKSDKKDEKKNDEEEEDPKPVNDEGPIEEDEIEAMEESLNSDPEIEESLPVPEEEEPSPDITPEEPAPEGSVHDLAYPQTQIETSRLVKNGKVKYVKVKQIGKPWKLVVLGESKDGTYLKLGEVSKMELGSLPTQLRNALSDLEGKPEMSIEEDLMEYPGALDAFTVAEGSLNSAAPLRYNYGNDRKMGKGLLEGLIAKWKGTFKATNPKFTLVIFNNKTVEKIRKEFPHMLPGVPYMMINSKNAKPQYIEMRSTPLNTKTPNMEELMRFVSVMEEVNSILEGNNLGRFGDKAVNSALRYFRHNFTLRDNEVVFKSAEVTLKNLQTFLPGLTQEQFNKLENLSNEFVPLVFGAGKGYVKMSLAEAQEKYHDNEGGEYAFTEPNKAGNVLVKYRPKGSLKFELLYETRLQSGRGKAQFMLDDIVKRHPDFAFMDGKPLKRSDRIKRSDGKARFHTTSLLSESDSANNTYYKLLREWFLERMKKDDPNFAEKEKDYKKVKSNMIEDHLRENYPEVLEEFRKSVVGTNLTVENLQELITFGEGFWNSRTGKREFLEQNLRIGPFNQMGQNIQENLEMLDSLLSSYFEGVSLPKVTVRFDAAPTNNLPSEPAGPVSGTDTSNEGEGRRSHIKRRSQRIDAGSLEGSSTTNEAVEKEEEVMDKQNLCK